MATLSEHTLEVVEKFNQAFNRQDLDVVMALMTDNCVFEDTYPAPDGTRHTGHEEVREAFASFFRSSPGAEFIAEEVFATSSRCVVRWVYRWDAHSDQRNYVRGIDVFRVQEGKVAEKLAYVKG
jgi:ketosteroid isomerase-like protein